MAPSSADRDPLEVLADDFLARRRRGESPQLHEYIEKYPQLADEIRDLFPTLQLMDDAAPGTVDLKAGSGSTVSDAGIKKLERVGDYRILKEIGRGAMGVVYEAEQQSLGRRVALKVLPRQLSTDEKALGRFRREARAAARLHHTNIVPVFEVGQDGDTLYYAMQYIQGQSLDKVLAELRRMRNSTQVAVTGSTGNVEARTAALSLCRGHFSALNAGPSNLEQPVEDNAAGVKCEHAASADALAETGKGTSPDPDATVSAGGLSGVQPLLPAYFRSVAQIGEQTASALSYAHERDTVHRDIKPSNLLLDTNGVLWVADFGLAKFEDDGHTRTGDLVGTLRYMSPERFEGRCDARADVYSLGVTLYELLLLQPAFTSTNQLELMDQISNLEPRWPRAVDPRIPRDLETIVMKAMEKEPTRRYQSAREMQEDLHCFLEDEPIQARKASHVERFTRWARRNRAVASLSTSSFVLLITLAVVSAALAISANRERETAETKEAVTSRAKEEVDRQMYLTDMRLVQQADDDGNIGLVTAVLEKYLPTEGGRDLRGWEWFYWWRQSHAYGTQIDASTMPAESGNFMSVARAPDGHTFAVDLPKGGIAICDWRQRKATRCLSVDSSARFQSLAYVHRGGVLAAAGIDDSVYLWDTTTWKQLPSIAGGGQRVAVSEIGPYGAILAVAKSGKGVTLWETSSWTIVQTVSSESVHPITCLAFSPDGTTLVAGSSQHNAFFKTPSLDGGLHVWDVATGEPKACTQPINVGVLSASFSLDGRFLAVGRVDHTLQVMHAQKLAPACTLPVSAPVLSVLFSPDSSLLAASTSRDNAIRVWDTNSFALVTVIKGHNWLVPTMAFLDDCGTLLSAGWDDTLRLWNVRQVVAVNIIGGQFHRLVFSPDGNSIIAFRNDGRICSCDVDTAQVNHYWNDDEPYLNAAFSHSGQIIAAITKSGKLRISRLGPEGTANEFPIENVEFVGDKDLFHGSGMAVDDSGRYVGWNEERGTGYSVALYDCLQRTQRTVADITRAPHHHLEFSPDHAYLISLCVDDYERLKQIWPLDTNQGIGLPVGTTVCGTFSPDGKRLAITTGAGYYVDVFETDTWKRLYRLQGHTSAVYCMAFSPDGKSLASGGSDDTVRVWDVDSETLRIVLKGHREAVISVAFSPDGRTIASCSCDGTLRLWRAATLAEVEKASKPRR